MRPGAAALRRDEHDGVAARPERRAAQGQDRRDSCRERLLRGDTPRRADAGVMDFIEDHQRPVPRVSRMGQEHLRRCEQRLVGDHCPQPLAADRIHRSPLPLAQQRQRRRIRRRPRGRPPPPIRDPQGRHHHQHPGDQAISDQTVSEFQAELGLTRARASLDQHRFPPDRIQDHRQRRSLPRT